MEGRPASTRLFRSDFAEWFTHVHPRTPFILYLPMFIACLFIASRFLSTQALIGLFLLGLFNWSLMEYFLHRYVFHMKARSPLGKRIAYLIHYVHHDNPNEEDRVVMPPIVSLPIAVLLLSLHLFLLGIDGLPHMAGLGIGYLYYDFVHASVHTGRNRWGWVAVQRRNHFSHHFKDETRRFGVSTPIWDFVFGTY